MINLYINYYTDKQSPRTAELDFCLSENLNNSLINKVYVLVEDKDVDKLPVNTKLVKYIINSRPSYNDFFSFFEPEAINIIANSDVIIPKETCEILPVRISDKTCLALTRWDIIKRDHFPPHVDYKDHAIFLNSWDSQDTWVFKNRVGVVHGADFPLGTPGCDNKISHLISECGYKLENPSRTLKTYHYHISDVRNYLDINPATNDIFRLPPPYLLLTPTE